MTQEKFNELKDEITNQFIKMDRIGDENRKSIYYWLGWVQSYLDNNKTSINGKQLDYIIKMF